MKIRCRICDGITDVELTLEQEAELSIPRYERARHIQDILPDHDRAIRELFISETCGTCFDKMFAEEFDVTVEEY